MLNSLLNFGIDKNVIFCAVVISFLMTLLIIKLTIQIMPRDQGRQYAMNGALSAGKPRGVGIVFILCFVFLSLLILPLETEFTCYLFLMTLVMLSGFLDDRSQIPWGEYKKGFIDLIIAISSVSIYYFYDEHIKGLSTIYQILTLICAVIVIWVSINVTNCSDGVDGLCGSLSCVTLFTIFLFIQKENTIYATAILMLIACILGYLWFNVSPSVLLMGDAGSRAIGYFIAIACLKFLPFYYFAAVAFVLLLDGGIGIVKVVLLRFFKIRILKNVQTPLHDFVRRSLGWSDGQVVFRFCMIQIVISVVSFYLLF